MLGLKGLGTLGARPSGFLAAEVLQNNSVVGDQVPHPSSPKRPRTRMLTVLKPSIWTVPISSGFLGSSPVFCMVKLTLLAPLSGVISASHSSATLKLPLLFGGFQKARKGSVLAHSCCSLLPVVADSVQ